MSLVIMIILFSSLLSLVFTYYAVTERDLLKAVGFSAGQSIAYSIILQAFAAVDVILAYIAVSVGIYTALLVYVVSKTTRYDGDRVE
ncbi:MAG: hydrogenase subunit MbhD domain-containing protein [Desulfurococcaceae archaeon]